MTQSIPDTLPATHNPTCALAAPRSKWRRWAPALGTLVVGLLISIAVWCASLNAARKFEHEKFSTIAQRVGRMTSARMKTYVYGLKGARGLMLASDRVTREEWRRYAESRDLKHEFPGAFGFGFIEPVRRENLEEFVAEARADGAGGFNVRTSGTKPELMVIKYIEPLADNSMALGFDIATDPVRRAAAESAMLSGEPTVSGAIRLLQNNRAGALYMVPIYKSKKIPDTPDERRREITGWVYTPVVIDQIMADVVSMNENLIDFEIFDGLITADNLLYDADGDIAANRPTIDASLHSDRTYTMEIPVSVGGRQWTVLVSTSAGFDAACSRVESTIILIASVLGSLLAATIVYFLREAQIRAIALAEQMTEELRDAKQRADDASRAKSDFIANMSHEIRTPMSAIIGYADIMLSPEHNEEQRGSCLQGIRRSGRHLLGLINDMLDLSKIEAGKLSIDRNQVSLPQLLDDVCAMMGPRAAEKSLKFTLHFDGPLPPRVLTDQLRLKQTLVNLVGNAIKFTQAGFVTITVSCDGPAEHCMVHVTISDSGIGMAPEVIERLFQPFEQADASTTRKFGGTGLGLAISRRLARLLGGDIVAKSTLAQGSTFTLTFDAGQVEEGQLITGLSEQITTPTATLTMPLTGKPLTGLRVLLAEDGVDNRAIVSHYLQHAGAIVSIAENGVEAVEKAMSAAFGVVLMDMQMPEMDGLTAASELRRQGYGVPIIALTANAMSEDRDRCLTAGCTDYLAKPVDRDLLVRTLLRLTRAQKMLGANWAIAG